MYAGNSMQYVFDGAYAGIDPLSYPCTAVVLGLPIVPHSVGSTSTNWRPQ
jgi:hypothetical protein